MHLDFGWFEFHTVNDFPHTVFGCSFYFDGQLKRFYDYAVL